MTIEDMTGRCAANTDEAIQAALAKRYADGRNAYWMSHGRDKYPVLVILVIGEYANVHFLSDTLGAGLQAGGGTLGLSSSGTTLFFMSQSREPEHVPNRFVISVAEALSAAQEFARTSQVPSCLRWLQL